jgi:hypothetical protein
MASQVDIINLALLRLGCDTIAAIYPTEQSKEARFGTFFFEPAKKAVLRSFPWSCATVVAELTALETAQTGFDYAYQLPTDCLRAIKLVPESDTYFFEIRNDGVLVTNVPDAVLKYVKDVDDTTEFDDQFVEALSYRLAADMALPVTGNAGLLQAMVQMFNAAIIRARASDAQENRVQDLKGRDFLNARA